MSMYRPRRYKEKESKRFYGSGYAELYSVGKNDDSMKKEDTIHISTSSHTSISGMLEELKHTYNLEFKQHDFFYYIVEDYYEAALNGYAKLDGKRVFVNLNLYFTDSDEPLMIEDVEKMNDLEIVDGNVDLSNHSKW